MSQQSCRTKNMGDLPSKESPCNQVLSPLSIDGFAYTALNNRSALAGARETVASIRTVELTWNSTSYHIRLRTANDVHLERCGIWMVDSMYFKKEKLDKMRPENHSIACGGSHACKCEVRRPFQHDIHLATGWKYELKHLQYLNCNKRHSGYMRLYTTAYDKYYGTIGSIRAASRILSHNLYQSIEIRAFGWFLIVYASFIWLISVLYVRRQSHYECFHIARSRSVRRTCRFYRTRYIKSFWACKKRQSRYTMRLLVWMSFLLMSGMFGALNMMEGN
jgi:hypothetical protein